MAPAVSTLKVAHDKLATLPNNLLTAKATEMDKYKMIWAPATWFNGEKREKTKGIWTDGVRTSPVFPLWGVIDGKKSQLSDYGNLWYDKDSGTSPTRAGLLKSKFSVYVTYPKLPPKHVDEAYAQTVNNQLYCLDAIQDNAMAALTAAGEEFATTTDWARFEEGDDGTVGWFQASLGPVYESKIKKVKGKAVTNRGLVQASTEAAIEKVDIVDDTLGFLEHIKNHNLRHNEKIPCFLPNGERIGRSASELRKELYDGRWVRVDVEMVMWNMKADGKRIFQLQVVRLEVISAPPASMDGSVFASLDPNDYKIGNSSRTHQPPSLTGADTSATADEKGDDDTDTFSESSDKAKLKRSANEQGGRPPKR